MPAVPYDIMDIFNTSTHHPLRESRLATLVFESRQHDVAGLLTAAGAWLTAHPGRVRDLALSLGDDAAELRIYVEDNRPSRAPSRAPSHAPAPDGPTVT